MSRPLKNIEEGSKAARAVRLDDRTYRQLRSVKDMMSDDLGIEIHLNQAVQLLVKNYIESELSRLKDEDDKLKGATKEAERQLKVETETAAVRARLGLEE